MAGQQQDERQKNAPIPIEQLTVRARIEARVYVGRILCPRGQVLGLCR